MSICGRPSHARLRSVAVLGLAALMQGCTTTPITPFSTAASMLVEVEVYKGPLTKTLEGQVGELLAISREAVDLLEVYLTQSRLQWNVRCRSMPPTIECKYLDEMNKRGKAVQNAIAAYIGSSSDSAEAKAIKKDVVEGDKSERRKLVINATEAATRLKVEAFYWAEVQIPDFPPDRDIRRLIVGFTNLASELSNQISSRIDALAKQMDDGTNRVEREALPVSDYLKSAGPTDFLHLFDWYRAVVPDAPGEAAQSDLTPEDRVRLAKRLFADHFWTKINEVHASGQGEVRMALIKDDIGNWNLKSFDNDPEQLLNAYRELTSAGIEAAIRLAQNVGTGGSAAGLEMLSQFARGRVGSPTLLTADRLSSLRQRAVADLASVRNRLRTDQPALVQEETSAKAELDALPEKVRTARESYDKAQKDRFKAEEELKLARSIGAPNLTPREQEVVSKRADEDEKQRALRTFEAEQEQARGKHAAAQRKHLDYVTARMNEAKTAVAVHARVIEGLKEIQTVPAGGKTLVPPLPNVNSPTSFPR